MMLRRLATYAIVLALAACAPPAQTGSARTLIVVGAKHDRRVAALYGPHQMTPRDVSLEPPRGGEARSILHALDAVPADSFQSYRVATRSDRVVVCEPRYETCAVYDHGRKRCEFISEGSEPVWARVASDDGYLAISRFPGASLVELGETRVDVYRLADCRHMTRLRDVPDGPSALLWR